MQRLDTDCPNALGKQEYVRPRVHDVRSVDPEHFESRARRTPSARACWVRWITASENHDILGTIRGISWFRTAIDSGSASP